MTLADDLQSGPKAIIAATPTGTRRCEDFILAVGGTLDQLHRARTVEELSGMVDLAELFAVVTDDPDALAAHGLEPVIGVFDPTLLTPDAATVERLARSEPAAWAPLVERLVRGHLGVEAPGAFTDELAEHADDREVWVEALRGALARGLDAPEFATALLRDWLCALSRDDHADEVAALDDE